MLIEILNMLKRDKMRLNQNKHTLVRVICQL